MEKLRLWRVTGRPQEACKPQDTHSSCLPPWLVWSLSTISLPSPELVWGSGRRAVKPKGLIAWFWSQTTRFKAQLRHSPAVSVCLDSTVDDYIPKKWLPTGVSRHCTPNAPSMGSSWGFLRNNLRYPRFLKIIFVPNHLQLPHPPLIWWQSTYFFEKQLAFVLAF